jgi:hypothetical protein
MEHDVYIMKPVTANIYSVNIKHQHTPNTTTMQPFPIHKLVAFAMISLALQLNVAIAAPVENAEVSPAFDTVCALGHCSSAVSSPISLSIFHSFLNESNCKSRD